MLRTDQALTFGWGNRGTRAFISGEQRNKGSLWETGNIGNQGFDFWEQRNKSIYFSGTREQVHPWKASYSAQ